MCPRSDLGNTTQHFLDKKVKLSTELKKGLGRSNTRNYLFRWNLFLLSLLLLGKDGGEGMEKGKGLLETLDLEYLSNDAG